MKNLVVVVGVVAGLALALALSQARTLWEGSRSESAITFACPEAMAAEDATRISARIADLRLPASVTVVDPTHLRAGVHAAEAEDVVRSLFDAHRLEIRAVDEEAMSLAGSPMPAGVTVTTAPRVEISGTRAALAAITGRPGMTIRIGCDGDRCRAWALGPIALWSEDVADASASSTGDGAVLALTLTATGRASLSRLTAGAIGRRVAMLLDDHVLMVPVVQAALTSGNVSITLEENDGGEALARATASALRLGPLACSRWTAQ